MIAAIKKFFRYFSIYEMAKRSAEKKTREYFLREYGVDVSKGEIPPKPPKIGGVFPDPTWPR